MTANRFIYRATASTPSMAGLSAEISLVVEHQHRELSREDVLSAVNALMDALEQKLLAMTPDLKGSMQ